MKKHPELTAQTRQNLVDAFWSLYCTKRIETITVKEIAQRAGYNRGTFYQYFADVYDVLEQIEQSLIPTMETLPPVSLDPQSAFGSVHGIVDLYIANSQYYTVLLGDRGDAAFQSRLKNSMKPMLVRELASRSNADPVEIDFTLEFVLSGLIAVLGHWFRQDNPPSAERIVELMYRLMQNGPLHGLADVSGPS